MLDIDDLLQTDARGKGVVSIRAPGGDGAVGRRWGVRKDGLPRIGGRRESALQAMMKSAARSIGSQVGREIIRGVLGSIMKKR
jgi:hypothetical protein